VDEAAELGVEEFLITGGEPLLRKDLPLILERLGAQGLPWSLNSALCPNETQRRAIGENPPLFVAISLDGPEALHDRFRGKQGCYRGALEAIRFFQGLEVPVGIGTTVTRFNFEALEEMIPLIKELKPEVWGLHLLVPEGAAQGRPDLFLKPEQLSQLIRFVARLRPNLPVILADEAGALGDWEPLVRDSRFSCGAGLHSCVVSPEGELLPCTTQDRSQSVGNLKQQSLESLWRHGFSSVLQGHDCKQCWLLRARPGMNFPKSIALALGLSAPFLASARPEPPSVEESAQSAKPLQAESAAAYLLFNEFLPYSRGRFKAPAPVAFKPRILSLRIETVEALLSAQPLTPLGLARAWRLLLEPLLEQSKARSADEQAALSAALKKISAAASLALDQSSFWPRFEASAQERHFMMSKAAPPRALGIRQELWRQNLQRRWGNEAPEADSKPLPLGQHLRLRWEGPEGLEIIDPFKMKLYKAGAGQLNGVPIQCPGGALSWMDWLRLAEQQQAALLKRLPPESPLLLPLLRARHQLKPDRESASALCKLWML